MITAVATIAPYLVKLPGRTGWYFQRKVPADLVTSIGKQLWRWKAGNTPQEARKAVVEALAHTDEIIGLHRGELTPELTRSLEQQVKPDVLTALTVHYEEVSGQEVEVIEEEQLMPQDLWPRHSDEEAHKLVQIQQGKGRSLADLINLATRLKQPAPTTLKEWNAVVKSLISISKTDQIESITDDHARSYRDELLGKVAGTTLKKSFGYLKGLFNVAVEEKWVEANPFNAVTLKYVKTKAKPKQATTLDHIDQKVEKLPRLEQCLYWLMRFTGMHIGEASGVLVEDIDLSNGVIHVKPNELRPLKNDYRERDLPIIEPLAEKLLELMPKQAKGYIFAGFYDDRQKRWGQKIHWTRQLGVSPKACRDNVATTLRDMDVNERVIGSILGHTPRNSTGIYGSVSLEAKRNALNKLIDR